MRVLVGLGNPGEQYVGTRHNVGFMCVDAVVKQFGLSWKNQRRVSGLLAQNHLGQFLKPQTFMNASGESVAATLRYYQPQLFPKHPLGKLSFPELYVVFDDLDIPVGSWKVQFAKGPKVHNGVTSLYQQLGTEEFWHVRVGVDGRAGVINVPGHVYVLQQFSPDERAQVSTVITEISEFLRREWGV